MSVSKIYKSIVESYSVEELQKVIQNPEDYPEPQVRASAEELETRKIDLSSQKVIKEEEYRAFIFKVKSDRLNGITIEQSRVYLEQEGLNTSQINSILNKAFEPPKTEMESPYSKKDYYGIKLGTGLLILFIVIRIIFKLMV